MGASEASTDKYEGRRRQGRRDGWDKTVGAHWPRLGGDVARLVAARGAGGRSAVERFYRKCCIASVTYDVNVHPFST